MLVWHLLVLSGFVKAWIHVSITWRLYEIISMKTADGYSVYGGAGSKVGYTGTCVISLRCSDWFIAIACS